MKTKYNIFKLFRFVFYLFILAMFSWQVLESFVKWNKMDTNIRVYNKVQKENGNY